MRKDYIRRLIAAVRKQMELDHDVIKAVEEHGEGVLTSRWVDAELLCMVIEEEVLGSGQEEVDNTPPTDDQIIDAIIDNLFIRGIEMEFYRHEFSNQRSGIPDALRKVFCPK